MGFAIRFCIGESYCIQFAGKTTYMYLQIDYYQFGHLVSQFMEVVFKEVYLITFCIVNTTEIMCEIRTCITHIIIAVLFSIQISYYNEGITGCGIKFISCIG